MISFWRKYKNLIKLLIQEADTNSDADINSKGVTRVALHILLIQVVELKTIKSLALLLKC